MKKNIINFIDKISNFKWDIIFWFYYIFNKDFRIKLNSNKRFENIHLGERCFIVGNGPSLNQMDLSKITNEFVFSVNNIMSNNELYETINSNYHVLIDPDYLKLNPDLDEDSASIELLKNINSKKNKPICIVRHDAEKVFKKYGIDNILNLNYIFQHRNLCNNYSSKIRMYKNMPSTQNVVQAAILCAIFMGFKEIYLIGVDMTSVFVTYESNELGGKKIMKNSHAYELPQNEVDKLLNRFVYDNEFMLKDYALVFKKFKQIKKYSANRGVNIINATKGGGLDVFRRVGYDSLF